jgi:hypothetical protein
VKQEVIRFNVAVKIGCPDQFITTCNGRPVRGSDVNVVVEIPYLRLPCAGVEQKVIWMTVAIKPDAKLSPELSLLTNLAVNAYNAGAVGYITSLIL